MIMMEMFLLNGCACLAHLAVALLVWWVMDEWRDTSDAKLLTPIASASQRIALMEPAGLPTVAAFPKPGLAQSDLSGPLAS